MSKKVEEKLDERLEKVAEWSVKEFSEVLKNAVLTGYTFLSINTRYEVGKFFMTADVGLRLNISGEEIRVGAEIKFDKGSIDGKPNRAAIDIDYEFCKGRDVKMRYHDERTNSPNGNNKSINGIRTTDTLFNLVYKMCEPMFEDSPMPFFP